MKFRVLLFLMVSGLFANNIYAQKFSTSIKKGEEAWVKGDFGDAYNNYDAAMSKDSTQLNVVWRFAECCRKVNSLKEAERWYKFIVDKDKGPQPMYPLASFWLATTKKSLGKYTEAKKFYKSYANKNRKDTSFYARKARLEATSFVDLAAKINGNPDLDMKVSKMSSLINTEADEFGAFQLDDTILYYSNNAITGKIGRGKKGKDSVNALMSRIYKVYRKDTIFKFQEELRSFYNKNGLSNSNGVFNTEHNRFYFIRSKSSNDTANYEIWCSQYKDKKWQDPEKLASPVNMPGYGSTDPFPISLSNTTDRLMFSSNRAGGKGGFDIYQATINFANKVVSEAKNLGDSINTIGDELTPFVDENTSTLYFSSNAHAGLGGFDIFKSRISDTKFSQPENLRFPINTGYDDMYFSLAEDGKDGYFSSNRPGSTLKNGVSSLDIYFAQIKSLAKVVDSMKVINRQAYRISEDLKNNPISFKLFFEPGQPEASSLSDTLTPVDFETTVKDYIDRTSKYQEQIAGKKGKEGVKQEVRNFISNRVDQSLTELEKLCGQLEQALVVGRKVSFTLEAYATSEDDYKVAKRRINSVAKYLAEYNYRVFEPYILGQATNGGLLTIEKSIVEVAAAAEVNATKAINKKGKAGKKSAAMPTSTDMNTDEAQNIADPAFPNIPRNLKANYILLTDLKLSEPGIRIKK